MDGEIVLPIEVVDNATAALNDIIKSFNKFKNVTDKTNKMDAFEKMVAGADKFESAVNKLGIKTSGTLSGIAKYMSGSPDGLIDATKALMDMSDKATVLQGKLALALDQGSSVNAFKQQMLTAANEARTSFDAIAEGVTGIGLAAGDMFNDDELLKFTKSLSMLYKIGGATTAETQAAMVQIRQALAKGKLQGDEFKSLSSLPGFLDIMAKKLGVSKGEVKELASEGKITAKVFKEAMLDGADDLQKKLETIPKTFGDNINEVNNSIENFRNKLGLMLNAIANCTIAKVIFGAIIETFNNLKRILDVIQAAFDKIGEVIEKYTKPLKDFAKRIGLVEKATKVLAAVMTGLAIVLAVVAAKYIFMGLMALAAGIKAFIGGLLAGSPLYIIIFIIAIVIGALLALGLNFEQIFSFIGGVVGVAIAFIWDLFLGLLDLVLGIISHFRNQFAMFANFFGNVFKDPISSIIYLFRDMAKSVLGILKSIASALDKLFGSNLAGTVQGWMDGVDSLAEKAANKWGNGKYEEVMEIKTLTSEDLGLSRMKYSDGWSTGMKIGGAIGSGIDDALSKISGIGDSTDMLGTGLNDLSDYDSDTGKGSLSTKLDDDTVDELKAFAEIQYRLSYKHITPNVNVNFGDVHETADVQDITKYIKKMMEKDLEELYITEGGQ